MFGIAKQDELEVQTKDLPAQGFIRPSSSPYEAPILIIPKKDGKWRRCIDYNALNKQMIKEKFPFPWIDSLMDRLNEARVFSKIDLALGYHQIGMEDGFSEKYFFAQTWATGRFC